MNYELCHFLCFESINFTYIKMWKMLLTHLTYCDKYEWKKKHIQLCYFHIIIGFGEIIDVHVKLWGYFNDSHFLFRLNLQVNHLSFCMHDNYVLFITFSNVIFFYIDSLWFVYNQWNETDKITFFKHLNNTVDLTEYYY